MLSLEILHKRVYRFALYSQCIHHVSDSKRPRIPNSRKHFANTVRFNRWPWRFRVTGKVIALTMSQSGGGDPINSVALQSLERLDKSAGNQTLKDLLHRVLGHTRRESYLCSIRRILSRDC